jgi:phenylacetate-coenzyme A ligase PaaK-like adenylate-forming protein
MIMGLLPAAETCAGDLALTPSDILTTQDIGLFLEGWLMLEADLMERHGRRDDLLGYRKERVRAMIMRAVSRSPYYRDVLGPDAAERPLAELPRLSKATLMAEFDRVVTDPQLRLSDLRTHLGGVDPSQSFLGAYRVATTSGTTGRRSIIAFTHEEAAAWRAVSA